MATLRSSSRRRISLCENVVHLWWRFVSVFSRLRFNKIEIQTNSWPSFIDTAVGFNEFFIPPPFF